MKEKIRTIVFFKDHFEKFFIRQRQKVKDKIIWTFELIETLPMVPEFYLKHVETTEGLYEIRVQLGREIYRVFCPFDKGQLVIIANGFKKKTQKTPRQEIEMALKIKGEYENEESDLNP